MMLNKTKLKTMETWLAKMLSENNDKTSQAYKDLETARWKITDVLQKGA